MSLETQARSAAADAPSASLADAALDTRDKTLLERMLANQAFWVTVALVLICTNQPRWRLCWEPDGIRSR